MLKQVTCPEQGQIAKIHTANSMRRRREQIVYCSLWSSEDAIDTCRESCLKHRPQR